MTVWLHALYRYLQSDDKEKDRMKAGLTGAILSEKPNVKVGKMIGMYTSTGTDTLTVHARYRYICMVPVSVRLALG